MLSLHWQHWLSSRTPRPGRKGRRPAPRRPAIEILEDRTLPAPTLFGAAITSPLFAKPAADDLRAAVAGDFNGDGKLDLAVADTSFGGIDVFPGDGKGSFGAPLTSPLSPTPAPVTPVGLAVADFNGDGKLDLVVTTFLVTGAPGPVFVLLGTGTGTFQATGISSPAQLGRAVAVGDFDGDGKMDFAVPAASGDAVEVFLNGTPIGAATPTFASPQAYNTVFNATAIAVGDFNGDGADDIAVSSVGVNGVRVLLNANDHVPNFTLSAPFPVTENPAAVAVGDFNGDGKKDIAHVGRGGDMAVLHNDGTGTMFTGGAGVPIPSAESLAVADFNGDGKDDLAAGNEVGQTTAQGNRLFVKLALGDISPTSTVLDLNTGVGAANFNTVLSGDFNGDGAPDLVAITSGPNDLSPAASVFLNQTGTQTQLQASPTSAPQGQPVTLTATVSATFAASGTPTGTVNFFDGKTMIGSAQVQTVMGQQQASIVRSNLALSPPAHQITAVYVSNDGFYTSTSAAVPVTITPATTTPAPTITSIAPTSVLEDRGDTTLTISGTDFTAASVVQANGTALTVTSVSATQLQATLPASLLAEEKPVNITVVNPAPSGASNAVTLTVADAPLAATGVDVTLPQLLPANAQAYLATGHVPPLNPVSDVTVATFQDMAGQFDDHPYLVLIDWGDGTFPGTGTLSSALVFTGGSAFIQGSHTYKTPGRYSIGVTIKDEGGSIITANATAVIGSPSERFVAQAYQDLLHRPVNPAELAARVSQLQNGVSVTAVALDIERGPLNGQEYRAVEVRDAFQHFLHRDPDPLSLALFVNYLNTQTVEQMDAVILGSLEYAVRNGNSPVGFLFGLFQDTLHRPPFIGPPFVGEFWHYFRELVAGTPHYQVAAEVLGLPEYKIDLVVGYYQTYLHRPVGPADAGNFIKFVFELLSGKPDEQVIAEIIGLPEYSQRL